MDTPFNLTAILAALTKAINCREIRVNWPGTSIVELSAAHDMLIFYDSLTKRQHEKIQELEQKLHSLTSGPSTNGGWVGKPHWYYQEWVNNESSFNHCRLYFASIDIASIDFVLYGCSICSR